MKEENTQNYVKEKIEKYSKASIDDVFKKYKTSYEGLSVVEIEDRIEEYGKNSIEIKSNNSLFNKIKNAIINPFNIVLILVAIITFITDVIIANEKDYATFLLIISTIIISAIISLIQESKSDNAAKKLKKMISNKVDVIRDEVLSIVDVEEIVPGDIVKLSSGDMIPGDVRFIEVKDLFIDQSSLTGESIPVEKFSECKKYDEITEISNIGFMGTNIVSGTATAIVLATGNNTYFGNMAKSLYTVKEKNSFEEGIDSVSKLLIRFMVIMLPIILGINLLNKGDWWSSLLFAITIAVGIPIETSSAWLGPDRTPNLTSGNSSFTTTSNVFSVTGSNPFEHIIIGWFSLT